MTATMMVMMMAGVTMRRMRKKAATLVMIKK